MGIAKLYGQSVKSEIDGLIKHYFAYAGENISVGDFVEFINGVASQTTVTSADTPISSKTNRDGWRISATALDENKVFIAHSSSTSFYLHGVIVTINGTTITAGADTQLSTTASYTGEAISAVALDESKVFIVHNGGASNYHLTSTLCTISGTTITVASTKDLSTTKATGYSISTELLSSDKVFIAHRYDSSNKYLYGMVVTISGTTITPGTDTKLQASNYAGASVSTCKVLSNLIFVAHSLNSSYSLYALRCSISGTTITASSSTQLMTSTNSGYVISTCLRSTGTDGGYVFVAHSDSADYLLYGFVCSVSKTSISRGTDYLINSTAYAGYNVSTCLLPNNKVFIAHCRTSSYYLNGVICSLPNSTIVTVGTTTELSTVRQTGYAKPSVLLLNGKVFIAHNYANINSGYLYGQMWGIDDTNNVPTNSMIETQYETQVRKATTSDISGVAKTSGRGGTATDHYDLITIYTL